MESIGSKSTFLLIFREEDLKKLHNISISTENRDHSKSYNDTRNQNNSQLQNSSFIANPAPIPANIVANMGSSATTANRPVKNDEKLSTNLEMKNIFSNDPEKFEKGNISGISDFPNPRGEDKRIT